MATKSKAALPEVFDPAPVEEEAPAEEPTPDGFYIRVNGKVVWESGSDPMLVDQLVVSNARGSVATIGSHNQDSWLDIEVHVRSYDDPSSYLDMIEAQKQRERTTLLEEKAAQDREKAAAETPAVEEKPEEGTTSVDETPAPVEEVEF